jgi:phosphatidylserine/phosphatidylglycerophosphate/cardiolipin synthase-like enzyme
VPARDAGVGIHRRHYAPAAAGSADPRCPGPGTGWTGLGRHQPGTGVRKVHHKVRKVHHKLMVIDARLIIMGSFNYTAPANTINDENIIVLGGLEETNPVAEAAQRQLAGYALAEIDRTITSLAHPA